ncbi:MAG: hypothetical protein ACRYF3_01610 [Janthinobacterium lividum]
MPATVLGWWVGSAWEIGAVERRDVDQGVVARRRRSLLVSVSVSGVLVATSMAACGSTDDAEEYRGVCVDQATQQRVVDEECRAGHGGFGWLYFAAGARAAGIGQRVSGGVGTPPAQARAVPGGVPSAGATISRGGLGGGSDSSVGG